jgi:ATP-binding cassette, subfamily B, multidrug efflux pump
MTRFIPPRSIDAIDADTHLPLPTTLWRFVWRFLRPHRFFLAALLLLEAILAGVTAGLFALVGHLVDTQSYTAALVVGGATLFLSRAMVEGVGNYAYTVVFEPRVATGIWRILFAHTIRHSIAFFQNDFAGRLGNKLLTTGPALRNATQAFVGSVFYVAVFTASSVGLLYTADPMLAAPLVAWVVGYVLLLRVALPRIMRRAQDQSATSNALQGTVVDTIGGMSTAIAFGRVAGEDARAAGLFQGYAEAKRRTGLSVWRLTVGLDTLNLLLVTSVGLVGWHLVSSGDPAAVAAVAMAFPMVLQSTFQSGWIMNTASTIAQDIGTVREGMEALTTPPSVRDAADADPFTPPPGPLSVAYKDVAFSYGALPTAGRGSVLDGFSLTIPAGQKVGLVGPSGAGKSTLIQLLLRAFDPSQGSVEVAGAPVHRIRQDQLRQAIGLVAQDTHLFHRSLRENVAYGRPDATDDAIWEALRAAQADGFVRALVDKEGRTGLDATVGERGVKLSGGQRQRVAIARAVLKRAPILVLDEATSALDSESETAIQRALDGLMEGATVIAVAHRLSTLARMDRIVVLNQGRIVEDGSPEELRAAGGMYARLWDLQSQGFIPG